MRMIRRLRKDESGAALITALLCTMVMLALGLALLAIVDTQARGSSDEQTRDRGFNLAESVLNSEAFVLGRNWPDGPPGSNPACTAAGFGGMIGDTVSLTAAAERLRENLNASHTDAAYTNASWQVNICDDDEGSAVWSNALLTNKTWDSNAMPDGSIGNGKVWVRAQSTVAGKTRALVGLVTVRETAALDAKYGLVSGSFSEDLGPTTNTITNMAVLSGLTGGLLDTNPPVAADLPDHPVPGSGVTGLRCGLLDQQTEQKTCVSGAFGALSALPAFDDLVTGGSYEQYPNASSTNANTIAQLRTQAKSASGVYMATALGGSSPTTTQSCNISGATANSVVFIEKVGSGDDYCVLSVGSSVMYKALVIGSGRVIIRGSAPPITPYATAGSNRFTGVVYALNLQTADHSLAVSAANPSRELVRIEKGARVTGAVHADGKNAKVALIAPDFDTNTLVCALVTCPSPLATTLQALGAPALVDTLVNGGCLITLPLVGCTLSLAAIPVANVVAAISSQLTTYGSAIHSDVDVINALSVYGTSGVTPGTFRDLTPR